MFNSFAHWLHLMLNDGEDSHLFFNSLGRPPEVYNFVPKTNYFDHVTWRLYESYVVNGHMVLIPQSGSVDIVPVSQANHLHYFTEVSWA